MFTFCKMDVVDEAYRKYFYACMDLDVDYFVIEYFDDEPDVPYVLGYKNETEDYYTPLSDFGLAIKDGKIVLA